MAVIKAILSTLPVSPPRPALRTRSQSEQMILSAGKCAGSNAKAVSWLDEREKQAATARIVTGTADRRLNIELLQRACDSPSRSVHCTPPRTAKPAYANVESASTPNIDENDGRTGDMERTYEITVITSPPRHRRGMSSKGSRSLPKRVLFATPTSASSPQLGRGMHGRQSSSRPRRMSQAQHQQHVMSIAAAQTQLANMFAPQTPATAYSNMMMANAISTLPMMPRNVAASGRESAAGTPSMPIQFGPPLPPVNYGVLAASEALRFNLGLENAQMVARRGSLSTGSPDPRALDPNHNPLMASIYPAPGQIQPAAAETKEDLPPIVNTGHSGPMKAQPGDWACQVCSFVNWRRRKYCMRCCPFADGNTTTASPTISSMPAGSTISPVYTPSLYAAIPAQFSNVAQGAYPSPATGHPGMMSPSSLYSPPGYPMVGLPLGPPMQPVMNISGGGFMPGPEMMTGMPLAMPFSFVPYHMPPFEMLNQHPMIYSGEVLQSPQYASISQHPLTPSPTGSDSSVSSFAFSQASTTDSPAPTAYTASPPTPRNTKAFAAPTMATIKESPQLGFGPLVMTMEGISIA